MVFTANDSIKQLGVHVCYEWSGAVKCYYIA